jgi:hypothetical protein
VSEFIPSGYISLREALNRLGRELFGSEWTGEEHKARRGLISANEWLKKKDLPPARGGGAPDGRQVADRMCSSADPSSPEYQAEYKASERYRAACGQLRTSLERGDLKAAILDPFTGILHQASASRWRQHDADRVLAKGEAQIPRSPNKGQLLVKQFAEASIPAKPVSQARTRDAIEALKAKLATEALTRPQQEDFLRKNLSGYHVTKRQIAEIFRAVPVPIGRPAKSNKKV